MRTLAPTALLLLAACPAGDAREAQVRRVDSAGVGILTSPGTDVPLPWAVTESFRLGGDAAGPTSFTRVHHRLAGADSLGRLYLLTEERVVEVFDSTGEHVRTLGREGGGPGEFRFPAGLEVGLDGAVAVMDVVKGSLVRFAPDGSVLPEFPFRDYGFPASGIHVEGDTVYVDWQLTEGAVSVQTLRRIVARDTLTLARLESPQTGAVDYGCVKLNGLHRILAPSLSWAIGDSLVAVVAGTGYRVDLFAGGRLVRSLRREVTPEPATAAHVARLYPEGQKVRFSGGTECVIPPIELAEKQGVAPVVPALRSVRFGPDGWLWVERFTFPDEPPRVDVFSPDGVYRGTLDGFGMPVAFLPRGGLAFEIKDQDTGGSLLGVYEVRRPDDESRPRPLR